MQQSDNDNTGVNLNWSLSVTNYGFVGNKLVVSYRETRIKTTWGLANLQVVVLCHPCAEHRSC